MLVVVVILLFFGALVRYKWKNAAARKEEVLRLLAAASKEEAEIAKLQAVDVYSSPQEPPPPRILKRYSCAVCYSSTTTRCSQCKAVRYCSSKCQIIHWRQGHKDECRPASSLHISKDSASAVETTSRNQFKTNSNNETGVCSDHNEQLDDCGSSSSSLHCFSSSTEHSETSFDASSSKTFELGTSIGSNNVVSGGINDHMLESTSDSDEADVPSVSPLNSAVQEVNNKIGVIKMKKSQATNPDDGFRATSTEDKTICIKASVSKNRGATSKLRTSQSSGSSKTPSSVESYSNQKLMSNDNVTKFMYSGRSGNHQQVPSIDTRNLPCSKSSSTTSRGDFWGNEAQLSRSTQTRSLSFRSSENNQWMSLKAGSAHSLHSENEDAETLSQSTGKDEKTSMQKFVEDFKVSKQSKSYTYDSGNDSAGNYNHKFTFPPKLFMQLYSCDGVKLRPVGLLNCGNSCYANAVLQCLTFTRPVTAYLLQGLHSESCRNRDWCLICEFESLIRKGQEMQSPLSPVGILSQIQKIGSHISHGQEEDAHDFLRNVIDTMQSILLEEADVSGPVAEDSTLLGVTFGGYLRSKIKCMKCSGRSEQYDRMMDLTVEINGDIRTLEQALAQFTISETLAGDDEYKCSRCMSYQKAKKKLTVIQAPNVLTIVLKRFRSGNLGKLNKLVRFPEVLNLAPYMSGMSNKHSVYELYAVIVHLNMMNAAYSGHYISYVKDLRGEWFRIDDSRVSRVHLETVLSAEAYILFYARRTPRGLSLLTNSSMYSDGKSRRNMEAISSSTSAKKKNSKTIPSSHYTKSSMLHHEHERHLYKMHPSRITSSHVVEYEDWGIVCDNPIFDSSSDSSSIFSVSDAGSYSTDSTKDSNAEDISGHIFRSSVHHR